MNTPRLYTELICLSDMFNTTELLRRNFSNTSDEKINDAAKILIEAERKRLLEAYTSLTNNLSTEFFSALNKPGSVIPLVSSLSHPHVDDLTGPTGPTGS